MNNSETVCTRTNGILFLLCIQLNQVHQVYRLILASLATLYIEARRWPSRLHALQCIQGQARLPHTHTHTHHSIARNNIDPYWLACLIALGTIAIYKPTEIMKNCHIYICMHKCLEVKFYLDVIRTRRQNYSSTFRLNISVTNLLDIALTSSKTYAKITHQYSVT